jgi:uncharacterized protein (UPF0276 family)
MKSRSSSRVGLVTVRPSSFRAQADVIEWDNDIPSLATLLEEATRANVIAAAVSGQEVSRVAC